jgi:hypothetical protein
MFVVRRDTCGRSCRGRGDVADFMAPGGSELFGPPAAAHFQATGSSPVVGHDDEEPNGHIPAKDRLLVIRDKSS